MHKLIRSIKKHIALQTGLGGVGFYDYFRQLQST